MDPDFEKSFGILDCLSQKINEKFDFIYAVSVLHMLVLDEDRTRFYSFLDNQLNDDGVALICTIGNENEEWQTNIDEAFNLQKRTHEATGEELMIATTSCRVVSFQTLNKEFANHNFEVVESGLTSIQPDFPTIMYAVVKKHNVEN